MKKLFLLAVVAIGFISCSKNENDALSKRYYTLYHSQKENIQCENASIYDWVSNNEFVATISNGVIEGQFVGETGVKEPAHGLSFFVQVKPKYNLYDEPDLNWGASIETIRNRYGTPYSSDSELLVYKSSNSNVLDYMYMFNNNKLMCSCVIVPLSAASALGDFLAERYVLIGGNVDKYEAYLCHCYGKISDPKYDYAVAFKVNTGGILVAYISKSAFTGTRVDITDIIDIQQRIENLLVEKGIM